MEVDDDMGKIMNSIGYELARTPDERKITMHARIGRLLIGFFAVMVLLTFISNAAPEYNNCCKDRCGKSKKRENIIQGRRIWCSGRKLPAICEYVRRNPC